MTLPSPEERADLVARLRNELVWPFTDEVADMLEADQQAIEALDAALTAANQDAADLFAFASEWHYDDCPVTDGGECACVHPELEAHRARLSDGADDD